MILRDFLKGRHWRFRRRCYGAVVVEFLLLRTQRYEIVQRIVTRVRRCRRNVDLRWARPLGGVGIFLFNQSLLFLKRFRRRFWHGRRRRRRRRREAVLIIVGQCGRLRRLLGRGEDVVQQVRRRWRRRGGSRRRSWAWNVFGDGTNLGTILFRGFFFGLSLRFGGVLVRDLGGEAAGEGKEELIRRLRAVMEGGTLTPFL